MKKIISLFLCFFLIISISGCNKITKVPEPMKYPVYTFRETPTSDQNGQKWVRRYFSESLLDKLEFAKLFFLYRIETNNCTANK